MLYYKAHVTMIKVLVLSKMQQSGAEFYAKEKVTCDRVYLSEMEGGYGAKVRIGFVLPYDRQV